eukprot:tig00000849_g4777.t1
MLGFAVSSFPAAAKGSTTSAKLLASTSQPSVRALSRPSARRTSARAIIKSRFAGAAVDGSVRFISTERQLCRLLNDTLRLAKSANVARAGPVAQASASAPAKLEVENVVIIGSGPAGLTSAIYTARANLKPLVFEGFQKGGPAGGQLMTTTEVENFPGFPEGITGPELMDRMKAQALRWGAELIPEDIDSIDTSQRPFVIKAGDRTVKANTIIIATGATGRKLGLPREREFWNKGICACAVCDGASPIFRNRPLGVVGGGDTACEEAIFLTKYGSEVHLFIRGDKMRASKTMQDRVLANPRITVHWNTVIVDAYGESGFLPVAPTPNAFASGPDNTHLDDSTDAHHDLLQGVRIRDNATGEERDLAMNGLFYAIGHVPNTDFVQGKLNLDEAGYIVTEAGAATTSVEGVFAAGDVQDHDYRQAITAAGSGCMAALEADHYLAEKGLAQPVMACQIYDDWNATASAATAQGDVASDAPPQGSENDAVSERVKKTAEQLAADFSVEKTRHEGSAALRRLYHESERLLIVKYASPGCGPCRQLKPMLNAVVDEFDGKIHFIEIDIEADPEIAEAAGIIGTPTIQFFKDKEKVWESRGVKMKSDYRKKIEQYLN